MKPSHPEPQGHLREVLDLLETTRFSLETVNMALAIGRGKQMAQATLNHQLSNKRDSESKEASMVAIEALNTAYTAFGRLVEIFDCEEFESLGYTIGFWSTFEWCLHRLFTEQVRNTSQRVLYYELGEAMRRCKELERRLGGQVPERYTM